MLAFGFNIQDAVVIANIAAGVVVGKLGTATINQEELLNEIKTFCEM